MPFVAARDAQLWYAEHGQGASVLLVHGGLFDPMDGERFWIAPGVAADLAAAGYRVLVPDRRYSVGRTTSAFGAHSWDVEAADLAAVLDATGGESAHVVAGSNGCSAAARLALTQPARVRSLTLCWPTPPDNAVLRDSCARSADFVAAHGPAAYLVELRANGLPRAAEARPGWPYGAALLHDARVADAFAMLSPQAAARAIRASADALLPGEVIRGLDGVAARRLAATGQPMTVIPADPEDPWHTRAAAERLAAALPGAWLVAGTPVTPAPGFAAARSRLLELLRTAFTGINPKS